MLVKNSWVDCVLHYSKLFTSISSFFSPLATLKGGCSRHHHHHHYHLHLTDEKTEANREIDLFKATQQN